MSMNARVTALVAGALLMTGCASANIVKIKARSDYRSWDDTKQTAEDDKIGARFYLPLPYLVVHQSFPVEAAAFLVDGVVAPDGKSIRIQGDLPEEAKKLIGRGADAAAGQMKIPTRWVFSSGRAAAATPRGPVAQGGTGGEVEAADGEDAGEDDEQAGEGEQGAEEGDENEEAGEGDEERDVTGGGGNGEPGSSAFEVTRDLFAVGLFPLRRYFDLAYLPDFEEQYVISPKARGGKVKARLAVGADGVLTALGVTIDNSGVVKPLLDAYAKVLEAGTGAALTALGVPPVPGVAQPEAQGGGIDALQERAGTPITLRMHVVHYAVPGLYPLLKPWKQTDWAKTYPVADGHRLVGGFVLRTFTALIIEELLGPPSVAGHVTTDSPPLPNLGGAKPMKAKDADTLKHALDVDLAEFGLMVDKIESVDPEDFSGPLVRIVLVVKPRQGAGPATPLSLESARAKLRGLYPGSTFEIR